MKGHPMKQNEFEELQINTALQAAITPVGLEFNRNDFMLGEYFCRVYTVISYPSNPDYGWYSKLTNLPGTIVATGSKSQGVKQFMAN